MYSILKFGSQSLAPTRYWKKNYPDYDARKSLCRDNYLVVCYNASDEEKINKYSTVMINGVICLDCDSDDKSSDHDVTIKDEPMSDDGDDDNSRRQVT
jgi:hypothetical protein